jgi:hypothetical protein
MTNWTPPPKTSINLLQTDIQVVSPTEVIVDGINIGKVCDAIANMPQHASKFQIALEQKWQEILDSQQK